MKQLIFLIFCIICAELKAAEKPLLPKLIEQNSFTQSRLQAISSIDDNHLWVSGLDGTVLHTNDGGVSWMQSIVTNSKTLQFLPI